MLSIGWTLGTLAGNALDPFMWVGAIAVGIVCVRKKLVLVAPLGGIAIGVLVDLIAQMIDPIYSGSVMGGKIFAGAVFASIVYAIAAWRIKAAKQAESPPYSP